MILYIYPGACSLADHIALIEAELPYELMAINHDKVLPDGRDYLTVNPRGAVPALALDNGEILTENLAILSYIADQSGALLPQGELGRWRALEALSYMTTTIHGGLGAFFRKKPTPELHNARGPMVRAFTTLGEQMGEKPFLLSDRMSIVDTYLYWTLTAARRFQIDVPDNLRRFADRMNAEPSVVKALMAEGLT